MMVLTVYGKEITFSDEEEKIFQENDLDLGDGFIELLLHWI